MSRGARGEPHPRQDLAAEPCDARAPAPTRARVHARTLAPPHPGGPRDQALDAVADFIDVKSPYTLGHSRRVSELGAAAAQRSGMPADDVRLVRRARLVHDVGRLGVPDTVWDKRGPLTAGERERVRLHPGHDARWAATTRA